MDTSRTKEEQQSDQQQHFYCWPVSAENSKFLCHTGRLKELLHSVNEFSI